MLFFILLILVSFTGVPAVEGKVVEYVVEVETVDQVAVSPDGLYVVAVVDKRSVYLLSSAGDLLWTRGFSSWVDAVSVSGGDHAVIVAAGKELLLFDSDGEQTWEKTFTDVSDAAISGDGAYIVAAVADSSSSYGVLVMDRGGNTLSQSTLGPSEPCLSVSSDASYVAVGSSMDVILMTRQCEQLWSQRMSSSVGSVAVSSGGLVAVEAYSVILFDGEGKLLWSGGSETWGSRGVSISGDGKYVATAISSNVTLLDAGGKKVWSRGVGERLSLEDVAVSSDGTRVAVVARSLYSPGQGMVYILDNPPGTEVIKKPSILPCKLGCNSDSYYSLIGKAVKIFGSLTPPVASAEIKLSYRKPNGGDVTRSVYTTTDGLYSDSFTTDQIGSWRVNATFAGSESLKPSNSSTQFLVEVVEEKENTEPYQPISTITMEVGERRFFKTVKSGSFYYDYNVVEIPPSILYSGGYTEVFGGTDDYIGSTIKVMPWATPGMYKIRTEWGWSGSPIVTGKFTYTYQLDFDLVVKAPATKYVTSLALSANGKGDSFDITGTSYVVINGFNAPVPEQEVTLTYTRPDGKESTKTVTTGKDGSFLDKLRADAGGAWKVRASLKENEAMKAATSETASFNAEVASPLSQIPIPWEVMLVGVSLGVILLVVRGRLPRRTCFGSRLSRVRASSSACTFAPCTSPLCGRVSRPGRRLPQPVSIGSRIRISTRTPGTPRPR
jgi:hypothetical protein